MKIFKLIFTISFLLILFTATLFPSDNERSLPSEKKEIVLKNLLNGLSTDNIGLRTSSAFLLGEWKMEDAVISLMDLLHSDECEEVRISAALALYKIGNEKGMFAVKQAIRFDDSERVRKLCSNFYNDFALSKNFTEINIARK